MTRHTGIGIACVGLIALALAGCDRRNEVREEVKDLQQAQQEAPAKAEALQQDLEKAKADVAQLEQKLAMAKQGVTDDVLREREQVKEAVKEEERNVNTEIREAQGASRTHNEAVDKAQKQLEETQPAQRVETQVKTETHVVPNERTTEVVKEQQQIPVDKTRIVEHEHTETK